jgi:hypothetical protein
VAYGQAQRGTIEVTVTDSDGGSLPGASVNATSDDTLTRRTVFTDANGRAQLVSLDPATNYVVTTSLEGFSTQTTQGVVVRAGQTQTLDVTLGLAEVTEELIVTAEAPLVDVTKTQAGQDITLELTESLPTARSYQDYLQLVPGVQDGIASDGNPASRSGVNYRDAFGDAGRSTDNLYYFDGIDTTDRTTGTFGANLNTEIIQEQSVLTGAIPAEFVGVPGLVSNVVTKSGGNAFSGSLSYYFQDDSLVEDNKHFANDTFSSYDTAFTLGGPVVRDKAWFFVSYRLLETESDVVNDDGVFLRTVTDNAEQGFGKFTWAISDSDVLSASYMSDPQDDTGDSDGDRPNSADRIREQGGERYTLGYNRVWGSAAFELALTDHEFDINLLPLNRDPANTVSFAPGVDFNSAQQNLGGSGADNLNTRGTDGGRASLEYLFDTGWGDHSLKVGYSNSDSQLIENLTSTGNPPASYTSLSSIGRAIGLDEILGFTGDPNGWSTQDFGLSSDETVGFREKLTAQQTQTLVGLWDDNGNGFLDDAEIFANMTFNSTAGNPNGQINYTRDLQTQSGANEKGSTSDQAYIQDSWQHGKWSVNAGLRWESWDYLASTGESIGTFDDTFAPRLSVSYDVKGDGRSSLGFFYGEYYDAFRDNAADFAGTLTGAVTDEQVYVDALGDWVTFRTRGGAETQDAFFAPAIETPVTEEIQLQYKQDLGRNMMFEINLIDRETSDIAEDYARIYYDIEQYAGAGDPNAADTLFLGPGYFGFPDLATIDQVRLNYMIGTLAGGNRDWQGVELVFRKRYSNNWQMLSSYNYADGEGNTNSDSNFDGAGDVFPLDPRAPNRTGILPGLVEHLFKVAGSYNWDNGFKIGGSYRWNSGVQLNRNGRSAFSRNIPDLTDNPFPANGFDGQGGLFGSTWIADDAIGFIDGSEYGTMDLRLSYIWSLTDNVEADFFLDIFNLFDDQATVLVETLETGGTQDFLEGTTFVDPRRYYLGARLRF